MNLRKPKTITAYKSSRIKQGDETLKEQVYSLLLQLFQETN